MVDLRARRHEQIADAARDRRRDHVAYATDADIEHELRLAVKELGAIDGREVPDRFDALAGAVDDGRITDVAVHELDLALETGEPSRRTTRTVIEDAHLRP